MTVFRKLKPAFTLIELSISLFIIAVLATLVVVNYNTGVGGAGLVNAQESLFQNIKLAQGYALSHRSYNNVQPTFWGVSVSTSTGKFVVFADLNGNGLVDSGENDPSLGAQNVPLPADTKVSLIYPPSSAVSVVFELSSGQMFICDDGSCFHQSPTYIELKDKRIDLARLVLLNPPTQVDTQNCSCSDSGLYCCSFCGVGSTCLSF